MSVFVDHDFRVAVMSTVMVGGNSVSPRTAGDLFQVLLR